ncbi:TlpA disulfide reductase family protein [Pedobacter mucosus]|uniref:TlpA disulfide reductase family protein n=1 Tax=Pedobacter mucosus TaxID=2895286 RepID=UPI001EE3BFB1|nr:TlpA disulfide reductase family protein [Pedobacter mucosus]UKT64981.1 AhpC/TSA family protein [Pedobacter mucosus]
MKNTLIICLLLAYFGAIAQKKTEQTYLIRGQVKNAANQKVFLTGKNFYAPLKDSTIVDMNGNFSFKGSVQEPQPVSLLLSDKKVAYEFILANSQIELNGDFPKLVVSKASQSEDQRIYEVYLAEKLNFLKYRDQLQAPIEEAMARKDTLATSSLSKKAMGQLKDSVNKMYIKFIRQYPGSAVAVVFISSLANSLPVGNANGLMAMIEKTNAGRYPSALRAREVINSKMSRQPGAQMRDFAQPDSSGKAIKLSEYRGKYVLVDFWASWCKPCRAENPNVLKAYNRFKDKNFTIIGISLDDNRSAWLKAVKEDGLPWLQLSDLKGGDNEAGKLYGVTAIPSNFLMDPTGKIIAANLRGENLEKALEEAIHKTK